MRVAIVSSALAKRIWPGEDAIGKYIGLGGPDGPWREVVGIAGALALSGYVRALLYGIEPTDPVTAVVAVAAIAGIALAACLIPARRAVRVDPMVALRAE